MKSHPLSDAYIRKLPSRLQEFALTDDIRQPTPYGNLSLCLRVFPTGRKLWALRLRSARRPMRTLGAFAPGTDDHLSLEGARQILADIAQHLQHHAIAPIAAMDLDAALDRAVEHFRHNGDAGSAAASSIPGTPISSEDHSSQINSTVIRAQGALHSSVAPVAAPHSVSMPVTSWAIRLSPSTWPGQFSSIASSPYGSGSLSTVPISGASNSQAGMAETTGSAAQPSDSSPAVAEPQASVGRLPATLKDVVDAYILQLDNAGKRQTARDYRSLFRRRVIVPHPELARRDASRVRPSDIVQLIRDTLKAPRATRNRSAQALHLDEEAAKRLPMKREADKLRAMLKGAFNASLRGHLDPNAVGNDVNEPLVDTNPVESIVPVKGAIQTRHRTLDSDEMAAVLMRLGTLGTVAAEALELCIWLGGQRVAQVLRAEVSHYDERTRTLLIFDGKGRRASPRPHLLPVRGRAAELLERAKARAEGFRKGASPFLFTTTGRTPVDVQTVSDLLKKVKAELMTLGHVKMEFDARDLRRTAETVLASRGVSKDDRAHLLSHGLGGVQNAHYDRYDHFNEKVRAIELWHAWLEDCVRRFVQRHGDVIPVGKTANSAVL